MKKLLSVLLILALLLGLTGCLPSDVPAFTQEPTQTTAAETETTQVTEPSTEATVPESEPLPTEQPAPKPTRPQEDDREDTRPRPTEEQETHPRETEPEETQPKETQSNAPQPLPQKSYTGKEEVAAYISKYGKLPDNFITKSEANALGWKNGSLEKYAPGKCIGGDRFYNREGLLPSGKTYYECDIDTLGKSSRGAKRIVFTKDGDMYYTSDHYESFYRYLGPNQWEKV